MTAAVWIVGGPTTDNRDDLRHSLRSVATNAPDITEAWVVGDVPDWFTGTRLPLTPRAEKYDNQRASLTAFVNYPGAPHRFVLMNDDMFITEPTTGPLPTCRLGKVSEELDHWLGPGKRTSGNTWHKALMATAAWMDDLGHGDILCYEAHTPLHFNTSRLAELLNAYPIAQRVLAGELYAYAGDGGEGVDRGNAKVRGDDNLQAKLAQPMPYLSGNPESWDGALGKMIRDMFPRPCRWER